MEETGQREWLECVSLCVVEYMRACLDESLLKKRKKQSSATPGPSSHHILHLLNFNIQNTLYLFSPHEQKEKDKKKYRTRK